MRSRRVLIAILLLTAAHPAHAGEPLISMFRETYFTGGVPLRGEVNRETIDLKFQLSVKAHPFTISDDWKAYFAYTQISTWNAFGYSQPFHDNSYMPGIYFEHQLQRGGTFLCGLEHMSNGRPYAGNPVATEGHDDLSRGMNYAFATWLARSGRSTFMLKAKAGIGCGVKDFDAHMHHLFSQELFYKYQGYLTVGYHYGQERWDIAASVTPIVNKSVANVTAEMSWLFAERAPRLFLQCHYGFDEALCDCVEGAQPPVHIRIGLVLGR